MRTPSPFVGDCQLAIDDWELDRREDRSVASLFAPNVDAGQEKARGRPQSFALPPARLSRKADVSQSRSSGAGPFSHGSRQYAPDLGKETQRRVLPRTATHQQRACPDHVEGRSAVSGNATIACNVRSDRADERSKAAFFSCSEVSVCWRVKARPADRSFGRRRSVARLHTSRDSLYRTG